MANEVLVKVGTQLSFANHAGDFAPTAGNSLEVGTPTDVELVLAALATGGSAANSAKADLGATRARRYACMAAIEWFSAPTAGGAVDIYWSPSPSSTAATSNAGNADGTAGAYTGDGGGTVAESVPQLQHIGSFVCTDFVGVQIAFVGYLEPADRYGQLVVVNNTSVNLANTDDIETHIVLTPLIDEIQ